MHGPLQGDASIGICGQSPVTIHLQGIGGRFESKYSVPNACTNQTLLVTVAGSFLHPEVQVDGFEVVPKATPPPPKLDLVFAIDTTQSMWDDIDAAKASATDIVNSVMDAIPDTRIAVVDFRDFPVDPYGGSGDYDYHDALPFSTDKTSIVDAINGLTLGWGNDDPEDDYCVLMHAINGATCHGTGIGSGIGAWRSILTKVIILMTDAPPHDPEPFTGYTWSDVSAAARAADPIVTHVIGIGGADPSLAQLAEDTGGQVFTADTADDVVGAIMDAIEVVVDSPVADTGGPYDGYAGVPVTFDANGSYDPDGSIVKYEWDWNDDGTYDDSTTDPVIVHTFSATMSGQVCLRVTDNDGLTGMALADVDITEPPTATPTEPPVPTIHHRNTPTRTPTDTATPQPTATTRPVVVATLPPMPTAAARPAIAAPKHRRRQTAGCPHNHVGMACRRGTARARSRVACSTPSESHVGLVYTGHYAGSLGFLEAACVHIRFRSQLVLLGNSEDAEKVLDVGDSQRLRAA